MIKVALGQEKFPFTRVLEWLEQAIDEGILSEQEEIIVQAGNTTYVPRHENIKLIPFVPYQQQMEEFKASRISIIHAGMGNVLDLVDLNRVPIVIPRDPMRGEHSDGHQIDFCKVAEKELEIPIVYTYNEFVAALKNYNPGKTFPSFRRELVDYLISVVES